MSVVVFPIKGRGGIQRGLAGPDEAHRRGAVRARRLLLADEVDAVPGALAAARLLPLARHVGPHHHAVLFGVGGGLRDRRGRAARHPVGVGGGGCAGGPQPGALGPGALHGT